ncbi:MAG: hypothetical protein H7Z41_05315, partial [Cytophagales bacterium]|nr:hypothetical protein [Armatimonadota bacterium]
AGDAPAASQLVERCIAAQPLMAALLQSDPDLTEQHGVAAATLIRLREVAKNRHSTATERWRQALDLVRRAEAMTDASLPLPVSLTEGGAGDEENEIRAAAVLESAEASLARLIKEAKDLEFRRRRYIEKLYSDRATWQQSLEGLRNEAQAMNLNLSAPPPKKGLFGKKNRAHESVFLNYHTCRQTLVTIETEIRDHMTELKAKQAEAVTQRETLEAALGWIQESGGPLR